MVAIKDKDELDKALVDAAFVCDFVRVRQLLGRGADVNVRDEEGRTPLFSAVLAGSVGLVGLLLESNADVNAQDNEGWTALHFAAQEYEPEIARLLIARGANVNAQDHVGISVLWRAVFSAADRDEIVRELVKAGAKENLPNKAGETPAQLAARLGSTVLEKVN
jgi:ankyrin repeat protein